MQAQVTDLVLQRFHSADLADLPALLRFLLQHVNSQNATQVISTNSTLHIRCCSRKKRKRKDYSASRYSSEALGHPKCPFGSLCSTLTVCKRCAH